MKFNPKFGDTIVCNTGKRFICKPNTTFTCPHLPIYGEDENGFWCAWDREGFPGGIRGTNTQHNIKEIISSEASEPDLEYKLKVLQKENEFLTRLLLKEGKL